MQEETEKSGLSTAGLVLGIIGTCTSFIPVVNNLSFVMGVLAVIFGFIAFVKKAGKVKNIIVIILGILAIYITLSSQQALSDTLDTISDDLDKATGSKTEEILQNDLDVSIGDFKVEEDEYTTDTKLVVTVKNKSSETKSFSIKIEAVDKDGTRIEDDEVYASDLKAGQSQKLEAFNFIPYDKVKELKKAKFNIVEVSMY